MVAPAPKKLSEFNQALLGGLGMSEAEIDGLQYPGQPDAFDEEVPKHVLGVCATVQTPIVIALMVNFRNN